MDIGKNDGHLFACGPEPHDACGHQFVVGLCLDYFLDPARLVLGPRREERSPGLLSDRLLGLRRGRAHVRLLAHAGGAHGQRRARQPRARRVRRLQPALGALRRLLRRRALRRRRGRPLRAELRDPHRGEHGPRRLGLGPPHDVHRRHRLVRRPDPRGDRLHLPPVDAERLHGHLAPLPRHPLPRGGAVRAGRPRRRPAAARPRLAGAARRPARGPVPLGRAPRARRGHRRHRPARDGALHRDGPRRSRQQATLLGDRQRPHPLALARVRRPRGGGRPRSPMGGAPDGGRLRRGEPSGGGPMTPVLELVDVHKSFGRTAIIRGVSLAIEAGTRQALIGPNGAGKSTLFNLITGKYPVSSGHIRLKGEDVTGLRPYEINRRGLSRSFQVTNIFPRLSVFENLRCSALWSRGYGYSCWHLVENAHDVRERAELVMEQLNLTVRRHVPAGVLSYAEQRALEIGITIAGGADVILLDEPTSGMSRSETEHVVQLIRQVTVGKTLVMVEHDMSVVFDVADRIAVLVYGEIIAHDAPALIRANAAVQEAYLGVPQGAA